MGELREVERERCIETFKSTPELRSSFPLTLPNGASVSAMDGVCSQCKAVIDPADVHGRVSWPLASVAVVEAAGLCRACSRMTQLFVRLRTVGKSYQAEAPRLDGRGWVAVEPPPPSAWRRFRLWLVQKLSR